MTNYEFDSGLKKIDPPKKWLETAISCASACGPYRSASTVCDLVLKNEHWKILNFRWNEQNSRNVSAVMKPSKIEHDLVKQPGYGIWPMLGSGSRESSIRILRLLIITCSQPESAICSQCPAMQPNVNTRLNVENSICSQCHQRD